MTQRDATSRSAESTVCQGEKLSDKEIDALILSLNNVWRILYQLRSERDEGRRLLRMALDASAKGENIDVGQIERFLR